MDENSVLVIFQEASDPQPMPVDDRAEKYRAPLDKSIQAYVKEHYPSGVVVVSLSIRVIIATVLLYVQCNLRCRCSWIITRI